MTQVEMLNALQAQFDGEATVYVVNRFRMDRTTRAGDHQEVEVTILDAGPSPAHGARYHVSARPVAGGSGASGNPHNDLAVALAMVHWGDLG